MFWERDWVEEQEEALMEIWRCKQAKTQFNSENFFILIDKTKVLTKVLERERKKTATKKNLVKRSLPSKLHGVPLSTLAEQQQRREVARSCHTAWGPRALLGKWHGQASWHGAPVPNPWLLARVCFAWHGLLLLFGTTYFAWHVLLGWVFFKYNFWASFCAYFHICLLYTSPSPRD